MTDDDKFFAAVERAEQRFCGNPDKEEWLKSVIKAGASEADALQMFADSHPEYKEMPV